MVLLTAHVLNGKVMGVDIPVNSIIEQPFKIEETPSIGYVDISSINNWWIFSEGLGRDYLYVRARIKELTDLIGIKSCVDTRSTPPENPNNGEQYYIDKDEPAKGDWQGYEGWCTTWNETESKWVFEPAQWLGYRLLNPIEKNIAAKLKIGSQVDHFKDYGVPSIVNYGYDYHKQARLTREDRMLRAVVEVYNIIPLNAAEALGNIIASPLGDMYYRYMEFGIKGTVEDYNKDFNPNPTPGICDWLKSRAPFNGEEPYLSSNFPTGLTIKDWAPINGQTIEQFSDKVYEILVNGDTIE